MPSRFAITPSPILAGLAAAVLVLVAGLLAKAWLRRRRFSRLTRAADRLNMSGILSSVPQPPTGLYSAHAALVWISAHGGPYLAASARALLDARDCQIYLSTEPHRRTAFRVLPILPTV